MLYRKLKQVMAGRHQRQITTRRGTQSSLSESYAALICSGVDADVFLIDIYLVIIIY